MTVWHHQLYKLSWSSEVLFQILAARLSNNYSNNSITVKNTNNTNSNDNNNKNEKWLYIKKKLKVAIYIVRFIIHSVKVLLFFREFRKLFQIIGAIPPLGFRKGWFNFTKDALVGY